MTSLRIGYQHLHRYQRHQHRFDVVTCQYIYIGKKKIKLVDGINIIKCSKYETHNTNNMHFNFYYIHTPAMPIPFFGHWVCGGRVAIAVTTFSDALSLVCSTIVLLSASTIASVMI